MSTISSTIGINRGSHNVAVGHPQMRHPVQRRASDQQLRRLSVKAARTDSLAEDRLYSKDLRLSQRTAMVATLALPLSPSFAPNLSQVFIAAVPFCFGVAVLPNLRSLLRRDGCAGFSLADSVITVAAIVGSIGAHLANLVLDLLKQVGKYLRIFEVIGCHDNGDKLMRGFVHPEVEFAPRAATRVTVLAHFPLALAIDLDACRIYYHVQRLGLAKARQLNFQRATTTAQGRITRHAQFDAEQADDRARQPFGGAQGQAIHLFQSRHAEDGRVGVESWLAAPARALRVVPRSKNITAYPDGQTSRLDKSFVILTPVTETVRAFGFLLGHTSRLPALLSP
jgi:hypothetical protein